MKKQTLFWVLVLSVTLFNAFLLLTDFFLTQNLLKSNKIEKERLNRQIKEQRAIC